MAHGEIGWDRSILPAKFKVLDDGVTVTAQDGGHQFATVQSHAVLKEGAHVIKFEVVAITRGSWSVAVGVVPEGTDTTAALCPIGFAGGPAGEGWGYYGHDGAKNHRSRGGTMYGPAWQQGAIVTCELDFAARTVSFTYDGKPLGIAFSDLHGPVRPAASICNEGGAIKILSITPQ